MSKPQNSQATPWIVVGIVVFFLVLIGAEDSPYAMVYLMVPVCVILIGLLIRKLSSLNDGYEKQEPDSPASGHTPPLPSRKNGMHISLDLEKEPENEAKPLKQSAPEPVKSFDFREFLEKSLGFLAAHTGVQNVLLALGIDFAVLILLYAFL